MWIIKVEGFDKKIVRYASPTGGGTPNRDEAQKFPSRKQADEVALEILHIVGTKAFVEVEKA